MPLNRSIASSLIAAVVFPLASILAMADSAPSPGYSKFLASPEAQAILQSTDLSPQQKAQQLQQMFSAQNPANTPGASNGAGAAPDQGSQPTNGAQQNPDGHATKDWGGGQMLPTYSDGNGGHEAVNAQGNVVNESGSGEVRSFGQYDLAAKPTAPQSSGPGPDNGGGGTTGNPPPDTTPSNATPNGTGGVTPDASSTGGSQPSASGGAGNSSAGNAAPNGSGSMLGLTGGENPDVTAAQQNIDQQARDERNGGAGDGIGKEDSDDLFTRTNAKLKDELGSGDLVGPATPSDQTQNLTDQAEAIAQRGQDLANQLQSIDPSKGVEQLQALQGQVGDLQNLVGRLGSSNDLNKTGNGSNPQYADLLAAANKMLALGQSCLADRSSCGGGNLKAAQNISAQMAKYAAMGRSMCINGCKNTGTSNSDITGTGTGSQKAGSTASGLSGTPEVSKLQGNVVSKQGVSMSVPGNGNSQAVGKSAASGASMLPNGKSGPVSNVISNATSKAGSSAASRTASVTASNAASGAASRAASNAASRAASNAASNAASRAASNAASRIASNAAANAASRAASNAASRAASNAAANAASHVRIPTPSDIRLKQDIVELGLLSNGLHLYRYRYIGDTAYYVGVMAQEVAQVVPGAVVTGADGYLGVDYDRLGLRFMTWDQWSGLMARQRERSY